MKLHPQALLFDMDGVLIDSVDAWLQALNTSLESKNYPPISKEEFKTKYWGHDLKDTLQLMSLPTSILDDCTIHYNQFVKEVKAFPETMNTLTLLQSFPKAIITNTNKTLTDQILSNLKLTGFFKVITTGDMVTHAKPHPALVLKACELLEVSANEAVLIGDTKSDIIAGKKAGCTVIGVGIKADYTISTLSELPSILGNHHTQ